MNQKKKALLFYFFSGIAFSICFVLMLYYGKETFYVESSEEPSSRHYEHYFALISEETDNEYWRLLERSARRQAEKENVYLEAVGPRQEDVTEALRAIDRMIAADIDGIIMQGLPGAQAVDIVKKAREHNIPIITVDSDMPNSGRANYVGANNYDAGVVAGKQLLEQTSQDQYVGLIAGSLQSLNQQQRIEGFEDTISDGNAVVVDIKESNNTESGATQATYSMLRQYPQITALVSLSTLDRSGVIQGVNESAVSERPYIISFDYIDRSALPENSQLDVLIHHDAEEIGKIAIENMVEFKQAKRGSIQSPHYISSELLLNSPSEEDAQ